MHAINVTFSIAPQLRRRSKFFGQERRKTSLTSAAIAKSAIASDRPRDLPLAIKIYHQRSRRRDRQILRDIDMMI